MFARFDENPAMTPLVIKETKGYGRTDNVKTEYPLQTKFAGGIMTELVNYIFHMMKISIFRHKLAFKQVVRFKNPSVYIFLDPVRFIDCLPHNTLVKVVTLYSVAFETHESPSPTRL